MAGAETKRIIELTEASTIQSGDFIAVDSSARGTKKVPASALATSAALTAETNARTEAITAEQTAREQADEQMSERMDGIEEQTALIQNPTKTLSGALVSFTDGADMPMVACTAEIVPKQSGSGTPSPSNVRPISGWESVSVKQTGKNLLAIPYYDGSKTNNGITWTVNDDGTVTANGTATGDSYFYIRYNDGYLPYSSYHVSGCPSGGSQSTYYIQFASWAGCNVVEDTGNGGTFNHDNVDARINNKLRIIAFVKSGTTANNLVFKPMITKGACGYDDYTPYTAPTTHTTSLGQTVYGGTVDLVSGVLTVDRAYHVLSNTHVGTPMGYKAGYAKAYIGNELSPPASSGTITDIVCNMLVGKNIYSLADSGIYIYGTGTNLGISVPFSAIDGYSDIGDNSNYSQAITKFLTDNQVQIVYPLATPQTYTLTGQEVSTLLGENNVWADSGDVEITYRRDISIVLENLENALSGSNSLNTMMMSAPTENTAEEPTEDEAEDDMR